MAQAESGEGSSPATRATRLSLIGEKALQGAACVVLIHGQDRTQLGRRWSLDSTPVAIGRDPECGIVVDAASVSRQHVRLEPDEHGTVLLRDLGSTNGTVLNDAPLAAAVLRDGDRFKVGPAIFKFFSGGDVEAQYHETVYSLMVTDALTGAATKRYFLETLEREFGRAKRHGRPLALALFDIDHFKRINDTHGHLAGDEVLRMLGALVRTLVRAEECFARYGGEEFALVLPETSLVGAAAVAEKVRAAVEAYPFTFDGTPIPVTVSLGVAEVLEDVTRGQDLIQAADDRLYEAKRTGRNRVVS